MKLAIVGVTGLVGQEMLEVLAERDFSISELIPVASEKSCGGKISFKGQAYPIISLSELLERKMEYKKII